MVSYQKGPTRHAYAWQIGPFWQDSLEIWNELVGANNAIGVSAGSSLARCARLRICNGEWDGDAIDIAVTYIM